MNCLDIRTILLIQFMGTAAATGQEPIDTMTIRSLTRVLAADSLTGRATGTAGARAAARITEGACRGLGLAPVNGLFRHPVPLIRGRLDRASLTVTRADGSGIGFLAPDEFVPESGPALRTVDISGPAVFVGDNSEIVRFGDLNLRLDGAVAVAWGLLGSAEAAVLADRGVVAAVSLIPDERAFDDIRASRRKLDLTFADPDVTSSFFPNIPTVIGGVDLARVLLSREALRAPRPVHRDLTITVSITAAGEPVDAENVHCMLPGAPGPAADTVLALTAHYDHLGYDQPDQTGDSLYNGFSDNAAGVAMLLAVAEALRSEPTVHSMLFSFFVGEERGLLGSDYHVARPPLPLTRVKAVINLDAGAPPAPPSTWRIAGGTTPTTDAARRVAESLGWTVSVSDPRANSDYFPFVRVGVPAIFLIPGSGPYEGLTQEESDALRERWDQYHHAADEWHEDFPFAGLARYSDYARRILLELDRTEFQANQ